jgi:acyl carrier protein
MEALMTIADPVLTTDVVKTKTKAFITRFFPQHDLRNDEDIFALGFVNSLFALQLVMFVEKEFCMTIEDDDLSIDNFRSIDAIAALVERKSA